MSMAIRIKSIRESRGYSMGELSRRSGISKSVISRIEAGLHEEGLKIETLRAICNALDVPQDELLTVVTLPSSIIEASQAAEQAVNAQEYVTRLVELHETVKTAIHQTPGKRVANRDA